LSTPAAVAAFYERIWNGGELGAIAELLTEDFAFRGSLGDELQGPDAFADYVRALRRVLADYRCEIEECVAEGERAFAKLRFSGRHTGVLRGRLPTGRRVAWVAAALFTLRSGRIARLWVLGDLTALDAALRP
jgi:predicted ester cyclase